MLKKSISIIIAVRISLIALCVFLFISCGNKDEGNTFDGRYEYNPLEVGLYREYEISIKDTSILAVQDTVYYLKEVVSEHEVTTLGNEFVVERYYKATQASEYKSLPDTIWEAIITTLSFVNVENNKRLVRLKFLPFVDLQWDGNEQNNEGEQLYTITSLDEPYSLQDSLDFTNTLTVLQDQKFTLIDSSHAFEVYAENIGLIERSVQRSAYNIEGTEFSMVSSYVYSQKLISSGYMTDQ